MSLDVNEFPLSQTLIPYRSGSTCTRGHSERGKKLLLLPCRSPCRSHCFTSKTRYNVPSAAV